MQPRQKITSYWPFGLLLVLTFFIFGRSIGYDFVWDDERTHLTQNENLVAGKIAPFWKEPFEGLYIPVSYTVWTGIYQVSAKEKDGVNPAPFHAINILLHLLNGWLVFALIRLFIPHIGAASVGAALFMLHPLQVESVAWISEFRGLLATAFGLAALYIHWNRPADNSNIWFKYVVPAVLFVLAMLSKPNMVVLPAVLFVGDLMLRHRPLKASLPLAFCALLLAVPFIVIGLQAQPASNVNYLPPLWARPLLALDALNFYLMKLFAPFNLSPSYGRTPQHLIERGFVTWALLMPVVIGVFFAVFYKHARPFLACLLLFAIGITTVSGIVPFYFQKFSNVADRYAYFSLFPAGLALAYAIYKFGRGTQVVSTLLVLFWAAISFLQVPIWEKELTLWQAAIERYPEQALPYNNHGVAYLDQRKYEPAIKDFTKAIQYDSTYVSPYINRGNALGFLLRFQESIYDYNKALQLEPNNARVYYNRSQSYANLGQYQQAWQDLDRSAKLGFDRINQEYVGRLRAAMQQQR